MWVKIIDYQKNESLINTNNISYIIKDNDHFYYLLVIGFYGIKKEYQFGTKEERDYVYDALEKELLKPKTKLTFDMDDVTCLVGSEN